MVPNSTGYMWGTNMVSTMVHVAHNPPTIDAEYSLVVWVGMAYSIYLTGSY